MLSVRLLLIVGIVIVHCLFFTGWGGFPGDSWSMGEGESLSIVQLLCVASGWIILAVFRKENVSDFWNAVDSVQESFGI